MERVIVERTFTAPMELAHIDEMQKRNSWCLEQNRVRFVESYLSADRKRMICVFDAPDAESVRRFNRQAALPYDAIWTATIIGRTPKIKKSGQVEMSRF